MVIIGLVVCKKLKNQCKIVNIWRTTDDVRRTATDEDQLQIPPE